MFWKTQKGSGKSPIQLENEIKQLQLNITTLTDQLENFKKYCYKYQSEYNKLVKRVNSFCRIILDSEYARNQLGGNNPLLDMDIFTLIDHTEQNYHNSIVKERNLLMELTNQLKTKDQEIEGLKAQISRYIMREQQLKELGSEQNELPETRQQQQTEPSLSEKPAKAETKTESSGSKPEKISPVSVPKGIMRMAILEDEDETNDNSSKPAYEDKQGGLNIESDVLSEQKYLKKNQTSSIITKMQEEEQKNIIGEVKKQVEEKAQVQKSNDNIMAHVIDLHDYMNNMTDIMWNIVIAIGKDGMSESKDLKKSVVRDNITESAFNTALAQLRKMGIVEQERINTGWRWFYVHELSDLGSRLYVEKFKQNPIACEKQVLQREHTTALHGYCIKDAAYILQTVFGYDEAVTDRKMNSMKLYNGEVYIPDIIAKKKKGAIIDYFEVELGHHTQKDFNNKCDKMRMVTKNLYFIVPDADVMNKILARQIGQWVLEKGGKDKLQGTTVYLTTMTKLSEGKWENIYPF